MIHNNYNKLADHERGMVDDALKLFEEQAELYNVPLAGDDRIEKVAEAMATCIVESRPKEQA